MTAVASPIQGTVVAVVVAESEFIRVGQQLVVIESMKMEHVVTAAVAGVVTRIAVAIGDTVMPGEPLAFVDAHDNVADDAELAEPSTADVEHLRADLAEVVERHDVTLDHRRS